MNILGVRSMGGFWILDFGGFGKVWAFFMAVAVCGHGLLTGSRLPTLGSRLLPGRTDVLIQPLFAAFATVAALAVAAKAGGRVEKVGAIDPDAARLEFGGHV